MEVESNINNDRIIKIKKQKHFLNFLSFENIKRRIQFTI